jgi:hypothetical protein
MVANFEKSLLSLKGSSISVSDANSYPEHGVAGVHIAFSEGSRLRTDYWRVMIGGKRHTSSFDHKQRYGLPAPIDAIARLQNELNNQIVTDARLEAETGDLIFEFKNNCKFQTLRLTGYEDWEIHFSDGTGEYSNYVK